MLKISIAMTTCNGEKYVLRLLDSLLHQIRQADEVVIVDDCSEDGTAAAIAGFLAEHEPKGWRFVRNEERLGFVRNFRKAISLTDGDVVFLCDQDDVWYEDKLESISNLFTAHGEILAVSSSFSLIDAEDAESGAAVRGRNNYGLIGHSLHRPLEKISLRAVMHSNISPGCTAAYRRELADFYVANSDCTLPHDYEMNLMAAARDGLYFYNMPLVKYRLHGNNTLGLTPKRQTRTEIAAEKLAAAKAARSAGGREKLYLLCAERLRALTAGRLSDVLKLWRYTDYLHFYSLRERFGDIAYALNSKK